MNATNALRTIGVAPATLFSIILGTCVLSAFTYSFLVVPEHQGIMLQKQERGKAIQAEPEPFNDVSCTTCHV